ncbi:MAG: chemotaxis protein CheW [Verrucomicrobia bacterium]|nr:MAG: chemotaxis protein CheW [Verrucomicrobiota bacterium]
MNPKEITQAAEPHILFELAGTTYGIPSRQVRQLEMIQHITPVPNAPPFVEGVVFTRGQVIPAIDLRTRFGFEKAPRDLRTRLLVVSHEDRTVGWIVDSAREFVHLDPAGIQPPPETLPEAARRCLRGAVLLGERPVLLIDVAAVLAASPAPAAESQPANQT